MDWFTLTSEVLAKKKQEEVEEGEALSKTSTDGILEGFEKVEGRLSPLETAAVSCALEIAWLQLSILNAGTCASSPDLSNVIARKKIIDVIKETWKEIETKGTFDVLYEKTKEEAEKRRSDRTLKKSVIHNQFRIEDLRSKLKGQEFMKLREMNKKQEIIASLKDKTHEEITKTDVKLRYVDRWEAARQNQNRMKCQIAEAEWEKKLEEITNKCANEIRVHDELCTFLALEEQALLEEEEKWKNLYESEMKRRSEKLKMLETRRKEQQILHHDLLELVSFGMKYEERQKEINEYLDFKERLRKEQERERFLHNMATKIQAWWRGTMVRRGLGPFKKKKKLVKEKKKK